MKSKEEMNKVPKSVCVVLKSINEVLPTRLPVCLNVMCLLMHLMSSMRRVSVHLNKMTIFFCEMVGI